MKRTIRLTESDLTRIVRRVINEQALTVTSFLENGGSVQQNGNVITSNNETKGYKFHQVESDGSVVLMFRSGEGKVLIINPKNDTYKLMERGGMSDSWSTKVNGNFTFNNELVTLN